MNVIIKHIIFVVLMLVAITFSIHHDMLLGTLFLSVATIFAVAFLKKEDNNDDFYKLT